MIRLVALAAAMIAEVSMPGAAGRVMDLAQGQSFAGMVLLSEEGRVTLEKGFGTRIKQRMVRARTPSDYRPTDTWRIDGVTTTLRAFWQREEASMARVPGMDGERIAFQGCAVPQRVIARRHTVPGGFVQQYRLPEQNIVLIIATTRADMELGDTRQANSLGHQMIRVAACGGDE